MFLLNCYLFICLVYCLITCFPSHLHTLWARLLADTRVLPNQKGARSILPEKDKNINIYMALFVNTNISNQQRTLRSSLRQQVAQISHISNHTAVIVFPQHSFPFKYKKSFARPFSILDEYLCSHRPGMWDGGTATCCSCTKLHPKDPWPSHSKRICLFVCLFVYACWFLLHVGKLVTLGISGLHHL